MVMAQATLLLNNKVSVCQSAVLADHRALQFCNQEQHMWPAQSTPTPDSTTDGAYQVRTELL